MPEIKLEIEGRIIPLSLDLLEEMLAGLANPTSFSDMFDRIGSPVLQEEPDTTIGREVFDVYWKECNWQTRKLLVSDAVSFEQLAEWLSDSHIRQIMEANELEIKRTLSLEIYDLLFPGQYNKCNYDEKRRSSLAVVNQLAKHLARLNDPEIRENLRLAAWQKRIWDDDPTTFYSRHLPYPETD